MPVLSSFMSIFRKNGSDATGESKFTHERISALMKHSVVCLSTLRPLKWSTVGDGNGAIRNSGSQTSPRPVNTRRKSQLDYYGNIGCSCFVSGRFDVANIVMYVK